MSVNRVCFNCGSSSFVSDRSLGGKIVCSKCGSSSFKNKSSSFLKTKKFKCKIVKVNTKKNYNNFLKIKNKYFLTESNRENLSFIIELAKKLKLKKYLLQKTIKNFKGLKYRQQIILQKKNLTIINDSKSTSFSSSVGMLKKASNILWLLGGIYKKGDKLELKKFLCLDLFI